MLMLSKGRAGSCSAAEVLPVLWGRQSCLQPPFQTALLDMRGSSIPAAPAESRRCQDWLPHSQAHTRYSACRCAPLRSRLVELEILARDAELSHDGVQGGPVQSETGGRGADHTAALPKHPDDMFPLHLLERGGAGGFQGIVPYFGQRSTQAGSRGKDHRAFNEVLELPYVSRPMPAYQSAHRVGRNLIDLAVHLCGIFLREMPGEYGYVLRPIAQRRGRDRKDFQPIVEIASEEFIPHHLGEIPVGCRHQPDVNGNGLSAAQALKLLLL